MRHSTQNRPQHHPSCPRRTDRLAHCVGCGVPRGRDLMALDVLAHAAIGMADRMADRIHRAARRGQ
jgi:hypothetical protein